MKKLTKFCLKVIQNYLPDTWVLAVSLSLVVILIALALTPYGLLDVIKFWGDGFAKMYVFGMQMVLVLITGYVLALTPIVKKGIDALTKIPKNPDQAVALTTFVSAVVCYFNWAFGPLTAGFLAIGIARRVRGIHFPYLIAASYAGEIMRGPSSSIPLVCATPGNFMTKLGLDVIPVSQTLYSWWNILISLALVVGMMILYKVMKPPADEPIREFIAPEEPVEVKKEKKDMVFAEKLDNSYAINLIFALVILTYLGLNIKKMGFNLSLNILAMLLLSLDLLLHNSPASFVAAVSKAIGSTRGIIMQFPLYAGISGIMTGSGLVGIMSNWFVSISTQHTFPAWTFLSAGLVNVFVPSGGGQWIVQGPIMVKAANALGADLPQTIMAFAWGDAWTNQVQPFWALPLLGIAGLGARDIMGYCVMWTIISGLIITGGFILLSFL
ncbi:MAG: short-chain fatty acid transporter [Phascolarctobacterium sp.]